MRSSTLFLVFVSVLVAGCGSSDGGSSIGLTAEFREFPVPVVSNDPGASPPGCWPDDLIGDALGNIWFAQHHSNEIGKMSPLGVYTGFPVPTARSVMDSIAVDKVRGIVWVSATDGNRIMRLEMATGFVTEISYIRPDASPGDLTLTPDGTLWFTLGYEGGGRPGGIAKLDPATNQITEIAMPGPRGGFDGITVDASEAVWFVELANNKIGRYKSGLVTEFPLPRVGVVPTNIAIDSSGRIWVTEQAGDALARFDPLTRTWIEIRIPTRGSLSAGIAIDPNDNVWFTEFGSNKIGLLRAGSNTVADFAIPTPNSGPEDVKVIDGKVYFTEQYGNKIGQITVTGI